MYIYMHVCTYRQTDRHTHTHTHVPEAIHNPVAIKLLMSGLLT